MRVSEKLFLTGLALLCSLALDAAPNYRFRHYSVENGLSSNKVNTLLQSPDGRIWIGTDEGLDCFDGSRITSCPLGDPRRSASVNVLCADSEGGIWIGTDEAVYLWDGQQMKAADSIPDREIAAVFDNFKQGRQFEDIDGALRQTIGGKASEGIGDIHAICSLGKGCWLVGSDEGLRWVDTGNGRQKLFTNSHDDHQSLSNSHVRSLLRDREGGIWVGTLYGGLDYAAPSGGQFGHVSLSALADRKETLPAACLSAASDGSLWVASDKGGIFHISAAGDKVLQHILGSRQDLDIRAICSDGNVLWAGTADEGLIKIPTSGSLQKSSWTGYLKEENIRSLHKDARGQLWIGTDKAVWTYDGQSFRREYTIGKDVTCLCSDGRGDIWAGTAGKGVFRRNRSNGTWTAFASNASGDPYDDINSLYVASDGSVWAASRNGLFRFDEFNGRFQSIPLGETANLLYVTGDGQRLWMTSSHGLFSYHPKNGEIARFNANDGLTSEQFLPNAGLRGKDGRIFLGDSKGFTVFEPNNLSVNSVVPPVLITGITIQGQQPKEFSSPNASSELIFKHQDKNIRITFSALSFCSPQKNRYVWRLEGYDRKWIEGGNQTWADYTNLPAGRYRFQVKACNNDGLWNEEGASLRFTVRPPLLKSRVACVLYILMAAALLYFLYIRLLQRNEKSFLDRFESTFKAKGLHTGPSDTEAVEPLSFESRDVLEVLQQTGESEQSLFRKKNILYRFNCPERQIVADIAPEALSRLVAFLLDNATRHTRDSVNLSCIREEDKGCLTVRIGDNGQGMSQEIQEKIFEPFYQANLKKEAGEMDFHSARKLAEAMGGSLAVSSSLGIGSTFSICLPLRHQEEPARNSLDIQTERLPESEIFTNEGKPVILIVEDDDETRRFLVGELSGDYTVITAANGAVAQKRLLTQQVSLILSDWMMPGISGDELCRFVRKDENLRDIPFIILSEKDDDNSALESLDCGADAHIKKPFSPVHLRSLVDHQMAQRSLVPEMSEAVADKAGADEMPEDEPFMDRINAIIRANISNVDLSVEMLAKELCVSRSSLFVKIKEAFGDTPNKLILDARLKAACQLLLEGQYAINEISSMVGFNSPSYFSKCFMKQFGSTPHDWVRKQGGSK